MSMTKKAVAAVLIALAVAGGASAAKGKHAGVRTGMLRAAAAYLNVKPGALAKELRGGQTLAQLATAQGKSVDGLEAAMVAAVKTKLDARVAAGKLSSAREQKLLARAQKLAGRLVDATLKGVHARVRSRLLRVAAAYIGVAPKQLRTEASGSSLGAVAVAHGKTVDGLKSALLTPFKARLDRAVAAKRITTAQAQARLAKIGARIDAAISKTR